jgi:hypothetical protein
MRRAELLREVSRRARRRWRVACLMDDFQVAVLKALTTAGKVPHADHLGPFARRLLRESAVRIAREEVARAVRHRLLISRDEEWLDVAKGLPRWSMEVGPELTEHGSRA